SASSECIRIRESCPLRALHTSGRPRAESVTGSLELTRARAPRPCADHLSLSRASLDSAYTFCVAYLILSFLDFEPNFETGVPSIGQDNTKVRRWVSST